MSLRDHIIKQLLFLSVICYYLGGYLLINLFNRTRTHYYDVSFSFESYIPFYPAFIVAYVAIFGVIIYTYASIHDLAVFKKVVIAFYLSLTIHFVFFLLFPVEYTLRPDIDPEQSLILRAVHFYYWLDLPYNCFPSLHISNAFVCAFVLHRYSPRLGWIFFPLAVLISASVVIVKQHYIADVLGGFCVAYGIYRFVWRGDFRDTNVQ